MGYTVPTSDEIATYTDDQLVAFNADMRGRVASCQESLEELDPDDTRRNGIRGAMKHYDRGQKISGELMRVRQGGPMIEYGPARPIHTFVTGYLTLKAVNRLMGLCEDLYGAVGALLESEDDDDGTFEAVEKAHQVLSEALANGGVE